MDTEMVMKNSKHVEPLVISEIKVTMGKNFIPTKMARINKSN